MYTFQYPVIDYSQINDYQPDFIIRTDDKIFYSHKILLSLNSRYFFNFFKNGYNLNFINLEDVNADILKHILECIYATQQITVPENWNLDSVFELIITLDRLDMKPLNIKDYNFNIREVGCDNTQLYNEEENIKAKICIIYDILYNNTSNEDFTKIKPDLLLIYCMYEPENKCFSVEEILNFLDSSDYMPRSEMITFNILKNFIPDSIPRRLAWSSLTLDEKEKLLKDNINFAPYINIPTIIRSNLLEKISDDFYNKTKKFTFSYDINYKPYFITKIDPIDFVKISEMISNTLYNVMERINTYGPKYPKDVRNYYYTFDYSSRGISVIGYKRI